MCFFFDFFRKFVIIMKNLINNVRVIVNALFTHLRNVTNLCFKSDLNFLVSIKTKNIVNEFLSNSNDENENENEISENNSINDDEKYEKNMNNVDDAFENDDEYDEKSDFSDF